MPAALIAAGVMVVGLPLGIVLSTSRARPDGWAVPLWFGIPLFSSLIMLLGTIVSIVLFNRPKFAVPPHLRSERGMLFGRRKPRRSQTDPGY
jgi:hypothetical protein